MREPELEPLLDRCSQIILDPQKPCEMTKFDVVLSWSVWGVICYAAIDNNRPF